MGPAADRLRDHVIALGPNNGYPESPDINLETLGRGFRGRRGRVLMRESVSVAAAGGPRPQTDWRPADVSPDLQKAMTA